MVYTVPADPEWDLQALMDKVPELLKEAIAGGLFLGDIEDVADKDDVSAAVVDEHLYCPADHDCYSAVDTATDEPLVSVPKPYRPRGATTYC